MEEIFEIRSCILANDIKIYANDQMSWFSDAEIELSTQSHYSQGTQGCWKTSH